MSKAPIITKSGFRFFFFLILLLLPFQINRFLKANARIEHETNKLSQFETIYKHDRLNEVEKYDLEEKIADSQYVIKLQKKIKKLELIIISILLVAFSLLLWLQFTKRVQEFKPS